MCMHCQVSTNYWSKAMMKAPHDFLQSSFHFLHFPTRVYFHSLLASTGAYEEPFLSCGVRNDVCLQESACSYLLYIGLDARFITTSFFVFGCMHVFFFSPSCQAISVSYFIIIIIFFFLKKRNPSCCPHPSHLNTNAFSNISPLVPPR